MTHTPMSAKKFPKFLTSRPVWVAVALAVLGAGAYVGWRLWKGQQADLSQYQLIKVQRADIEDLVTATGSLQPLEYVDVGAQVSGQLRKIHVEIGSVVQAGDLLAEIDPTVYRANVDARRAQLKNLRATLVERESQLLLAQQQQARQKGLLSGDATTQEAVQQADANLRSARAQIDALQAQIEQSESTLRADEANLNYANIYSPMAGVVVSITARQGQTINATQQAPIILRVANLSSMTVQTQVSEADIGQLRPNMDAYFTTLGNRGRRWWGKLRKVEPTPTVTNNVVLYNALFDVVNDQRNLLPQMTAQVFFVAAKVENALVVPASAVTVQRGAREEGKRAGDAPMAAPGGASGASGAASGGRSGARGADKAAAASGVVSGQAPARRAAPRPKDAGALESGPDLSQMSREERRAYFESLPPEAREAMRERMRAARGDAGPAVSRSGEPSAAPSTVRPPSNDSRARTPTAVWAGVGAGRTNRPKDATVKVVTESGEIAERKVRIGISNRVQVEILEGLKEGEQVVAGVKPPPGQVRAEGGNRNALQGQGGMPGGPGGLGGAGGMGAGGRSR
jgi:membrane fusion protein, macrolide-specific efflux system